MQTPSDAHQNLVPRFFLWSCTVEPHKRAAVFLAKGAHQHCKAFAGVAGSSGMFHHRRKSHGMDPDPLASIFGGSIDSIDFINDRLDGIPAELISEDIQADLFIL